MQDQVYSKPLNQIVDFAFTDEVAAVFPDMIRRSIPGYEMIIPMTGLIAARHLRAGDTVIDLGCSLGATSQAIAAQTDQDITVVGIDNSDAMVERASQANNDSRLSFLKADALSEPVMEMISGARVIVMNFFLQFCEPDSRVSLLRKIHKHLDPEGLVILSEKIIDTDQGKEGFYDDAHLAWKRANGYSDLEVSQKRNALENVMRIDSEKVHFDRLNTAGFSQVDQWYKCLNWASFLAWKGSRTSTQT